MNFRFKFLQQQIRLHRRNEMSHGREMEAVHWKRLKREFPYKGLNDPEYIKEKNMFFQENGNGWWVNDGTGWKGDEETPMQKQRRYRKFGTTKKQ
jgi:hypothetical protein|tara:strand:- start:187 stop:471 length:285 start_codon:yes stop_codon:yes gene_type:complete